MFCDDPFLGRLCAGPLRRGEVPDMNAGDWDISPETMAMLRASIVTPHASIALRDILAQDYPDECLALPISGGWGQTQADAIVFLRDRFPDAAAPQFVHLEYLIGRKVIDEELVVMRAELPRFSGINLKLERQSLAEAEGRHFDCLEFEIVCWSDKHWQQLKEIWTENDDGRMQGFDTEAYSKMILDSKVQYARQFWFDISEVF
jgi:hypothetical protein